MGGQKIAIFTNRIICLVEKDGNAGTDIHVQDMEESYYSTKKISEILKDIDADS